MILKKYILALAALVICEKATGANSLETADALNNLANLYKDQTRYADADATYKRAIAIYKVKNDTCKV